MLKRMVGYRRLSLPSMVGTASVFLVGCSMLVLANRLDLSRLSQEAVDHSRRHETNDPTVAAGSSILKDLGTVLTTELPIHEGIVITNPSERPIRILGTRAHSPCCSSIEVPSTMIPPLESMRIVLGIKPVAPRGLGRLEFDVFTDDMTNPITKSVLSLNLLPSFEIVAPPDDDILVHSPGRLKHTMIARKKAGRGVDLPARIAAPDLLGVEYSSDVAPRSRATTR